MTDMMIEPPRAFTRVSTSIPRRTAQLWLGMVTAATIAAVVIILWAGVSRQPSDSEMVAAPLEFRELAVSPPVPTRLPLSPRVDVYDTMDVYWQATHENQTRGVVFLFHGCNTSGIDWFHLPEHVIVLTKLLNRGFHVVALESMDRKRSRCWRFSDDLSRVFHAMTVMVAENDWEHLPKYAIATSNGASFLTHWITKATPQAQIKFAAIALYSPPTAAITKPKIFPPTAFISMPKAIRSASPMHIRDMVKKFRRANVPVIMLKTDVQPFTPDFISKRSLLLSKKASRFIVEYLNQTGLVDDKFYLTNHPNDSEADWEKPVQQYLMQKMNNDRHQVSMALDHLEELMDVAWGVNEMTSQHANDVIAWFIKHKKS